MSNDFQTSKYFRDCLEKLHAKFVELRTDVAESIEAVLNNSDVESAEEGMYTECRFVYWKHNGFAYEYDTLTTLVSFRPADDEDAEWKTVDQIEYTDNDFDTVEHLLKD